MTPRYSAEALDADGAALSAAGSAAEEALGLHRQALAVLEDGWRSESGSTATDVIRSQCAQAAGLVEALHGATAGLRALLDALDPLGTRTEQVGLLSTEPLAADDNPDGEGNYDPMAAGLADRAAPRFETPAATFPAPAPFASPFAPWSAGVGPVSQLPDVGGILAGLVAQIADALHTSENPEGAAESVDDAAAEVSPAARLLTPSAGVGAAEPTSSAAEPIPTPPDRSPPVQEASESAPAAAATPPESLVPQPQGSSAQASPEPPELLAAERLPEPPQPAPAGETPCDIAADELPQVGE